MSMPKEFVQLVEVLQKQRKDLLNFAMRHVDSSEVYADTLGIVHVIDGHISSIIQKRGVSHDHP